MPITTGPKAVRRFLSVPRCTNTLSLYLFFIADALICNGSIKVMRSLVRRWEEQEGHQGDVDRSGAAAL